MSGRFKSLLCFAICVVVVVLSVALEEISNMLYVPEDLAKKNSAPLLLVEQSAPPPFSETNKTIYRPRNELNAFVIPQYQLIFFTFQKVACSEWKRMLMRINGNPEWCSNRNPHPLKHNKIKTLADYAPANVTAMMTSPSWTKAAIFREPKERVLSAFLDKAVSKDYYIKTCCKKLLDENLKQTCIDNSKKFDSFLYFVTEYPKECFNVHWEAQVAKIDSKWWPYMDVIGYQHNLIEDSQRILKMLYSNDPDRGDQVEGHDQLSAWEKYGVTGWGAPGDNECENRTHSFLEVNTSPHNFDSGSQLLEWYTAELEKLVEDKWAIEWQQERVNFPEIKLFANP